MSFRLIAIALVVATCLSDWGVSDMLAGGIFRSRTNRRPTYSSQTETKRDRSNEAAASSPFPGVDAPPGAPRVTGLPRRNLRMGASSTRPADTIKLVDAAIDRTKRRYLTVGQHTPWQILHGVLALRHEFEVRQGNRLVRGLDWLRNGVVHDGRALIQKTEHGGRCHPYTEPWAFEGHTNQFLAILSVASLPEEYQFRTPAGELVSMQDMVNNAKMTMDGHGEMTWTLWFLSHYLDAEDEWENASGQYWSMERLVKMEARQKVNGAPCGGTHRLFALSLARNAYLAKHGNCRGAWLEADQRVREFVATAKSLQNRDGSLSADWFKGRKYSTDLTTRLKTSGHQLEWLMVALPDNQLDQSWVQMAVQSVANDVIRSANEPAECGALYHALDALTFYKQRRSPATETEKSPTYLVPPATPSKPPTAVVKADPKPEAKPAPAKSTPSESSSSESIAKSDVAPKPTMEKLDVPDVEIAPLPTVADAKPSMKPTAKPVDDPDAPATFVAPKTIKPISKPGTVPQTASLPDGSVRAMKGQAEEPQSDPKSSSVPAIEETAIAEKTSEAERAADDRPVEPLMAKESLIVEEVDLAEIPSTIDPEIPATSIADAQPALPEAEMKPKEPQSVSEESSAKPPVEDALVGKPIPADAMPLDVYLPAKPDSESAPNVTDDETIGETIPLVPRMADELESAVPTAATEADDNAKPKSVEVTDSASPSGERLVAPMRPVDESDVSNEASESPQSESKPDVKKVAEEPADKKVRHRVRIKQSGLIVIQLDVDAGQPITVPMVPSKKIRQASSLRW